MQRKISLAVMAIMLFLMAAANSQAEETREPPKLLWFNNEETEKLWAEMMGFQDPVERLIIKKHYYNIPLLVELLIRNPCKSLEFLDYAHRSQTLVFQWIDNA